MSTAAVLFRAQSIVTSTPKPRLPVKRALFGASTLTARVINETFCQKKLKEIREKKAQEWGFDFHKGVPIPSSSQFEYKIMTPESIPSFYRPSSIEKNISTNQICFPQETESVDLENLETELDKSKEWIQKCQHTPRKIRLEDFNFGPRRRRSTPRKKPSEKAVRKPIGLNLCEFTVAL
ncbi:hypothetical protein FO519_003686 [Halicephalobus sp. NKZ332]|nr:hypothetical protein FO519_003686 [Halicephalobus sp. NKZ332]